MPIAKLTRFNDIAVAAVAGDLRSNEPNGMTTLGDNDGSVAESGGHAFGFDFFGAWNHDSVDAEVVVVDDATSPGGSGQAIHFAWDAAVDEAGVAAAGSLNGPWDELYYSWSMYWEAGGPWDAAASPKIFYFGTDAFTTANWVERRSNGRMRVQPQTADHVAETATGAMPTGEWVRLEMHVIREDSGGDGAVYLWINGVLAASNEAVTWNSTDAWDGMEWYAHINDLGGVDTFYRVGHFYISAK